MSLLCVGVQNEQTVVGRFDASALVAQWRVSSDPRRTADEWAFLLQGLLERSPGSPEVAGVAVCSAVPAVMDELRIALVGQFAMARQVLVGPGVRTGLPVLMDNPREVGTDRVANAVGAVAIVGAPCLIVDFGAATTIDVVNEGGQYVGGAIAPGVRVSVEALGLHGAQLRQVELVAPRRAIAKNTIEALQAGAVYGFAGQVDGLVNRMLGELGPTTPGQPVAVIATGHLASVVISHCSTVTGHEPWLMLHGLRQLYERNCG